MADETDIAVLTYELLKRMQQQLSRMEADVGDLKLRMTAIEGQHGTVISHIGHLETQLPASAGGWTD